jgi:2-polyprenyl-3-methyl-5-hydroxy-6-metoxy-1,4-benzoquinol methylase
MSKLGLSSVRNSEVEPDEQIRALPQRKCVLCGCEGELIHYRLVDRLFDAAGTWNFRRCSNRECELVWLDPMPVSDAISKAYANYYTHTNASSRSKGFIRSFYRKVKKIYLAVRFGYPQPGPRFLGKLLYLFPPLCRDAEAQIRFLPSLPGGTLLDVGCGGGEWLAKMHEMGWEVEGVDTDKAAVAFARERGLNVRCGNLADMEYPEGTFDAVTLNHVIEHVPDAVGLLRECRRVLKTGGRLVISTPNSGSLGHRIFKDSWRGLEPPRHLYLYSPRLMRSIVTAAGFISVSTKTFESEYIMRQSRSLWLRGFRSPTGTLEKLCAAVVTNGLILLEGVLLLVDSGIGENLTVQGLKP